MSIKSWFLRRRNMSANLCKVTRRNSRTLTVIDIVPRPQVTIDSLTKWRNGICRPWKHLFDFKSRIEVYMQIWSWRNEYYKCRYRIGKSLFWKRRSDLFYFGHLFLRQSFSCINICSYKRFPFSSRIHRSIQKIQIWILQDIESERVYFGKDLFIGSIMPDNKVSIHDVLFLKTGEEGNVHYIACNYFKDSFKEGESA